MAQIELNDLETDLDSYAATSILDAKYEKVDIEKVVEEECSHLDAKQKEELKALILKHSKLFDGTLGKYPGEPMHIELEKDAVPVHKRHHL